MQKQIKKLCSYCCLISRVNMKQTGSALFLGIMNPSHCSFHVINPVQIYEVRFWRCDGGHKMIVLLQTAWLCLWNWLLLKVLKGEKTRSLLVPNRSAELPVSSLEQNLLHICWAQVIRSSPRGGNYSISKHHLSEETLALTRKENASLKLYKTSIIGEQVWGTLFKSNSHFYFMKSWKICRPCMALEEKCSTNFTVVSNHI